MGRPYQPTRPGAVAVPVATADRHLYHNCGPGSTASRSPPGDAFGADRPGAVAGPHADSGALSTRGKADLRVYAAAFEHFHAAATPDIDPILDRYSRLYAGLALAALGDQPQE